MKLHNNFIKHLQYSSDTEQKLDLILNYLSHLNHIII